MIEDSWSLILRLRRSRLQPHGSYLIRGGFFYDQNLGYTNSMKGKLVLLYPGGGTSEFAVDDDQLLKMSLDNDLPFFNFRSNGELVKVERESICGLVYDDL